MRCIKIQFFLLLSLLLFTHPSVALDVIFINPGHKQKNPTGPFWANLGRFMQASAKQFDVQLQTQYANRDHLLMKRQILKAISKRPDYIILVNEKSAAAQFFPILTRADIKVLFLLNPPSNNEKIAKSSYWVANLVPDNFQAGYQLAKILHQKAKLSNPTGNFNLLAINGDSATLASQLRKQGLSHYLEQKGQKIKLLDHINANWSQAQAYERSLAYFNRLKQVDIVWAANDPMAYGAYVAQRDSGTTQDSNTEFGGINWDYLQSEPNSLEHFTSIGGHMTLGAFAIPVIYDHYQLQRQQGADIKLNVFAGDDTPSAKRLTKLLKRKQLDRLDYTKFSQAKQLKPLAMTLDNLAHTYQR